MRDAVSRFDLLGSLSDGLIAEFYDRGSDAKKPIGAEALAWGRALYRQGWRQTSNKYRLISRVDQTLEVPPDVFAAFKYEAKIAWEQNADCSTYAPACNIGPWQKVGKFMSNRKVPAIMSKGIMFRCRPGPIGPRGHSVDDE